jgi:periplasmic protein CpxP/Spy
MKITNRMPMLAALAVAGAVFVGGVASAQDRPSPPGAHRMDPAQMQARRAERAKTLHDALQLRADQEPAWQTFQSAMGAQPAARPERLSRDSLNAMTTPQRLDLRAQQMAARQAQFARMADVTKRFYATLSPAQQKTFDAMTMRGHMMGGHGRRGGGRGMGGGPRG